MQRLKIYTPSMQSDVEAFFQSCMIALGWGYEPQGRHSDITHISEIYMDHGCFWCLYEEKTLIGTVAVHCINESLRIAEMKRLYILPEYQGRGNGGYLFRVALEYAKGKGYALVRLDTRQDREAACHLIQKYKFRQIDKYNVNSFAELYYELEINT